MVALFALLTARVVIVKVAVVAPAATVTFAGTTALVLLLESAIIAPALGAPLVNVTVPCDALPPVTVVGLTLTEDRLAGTGGGGGGPTLSDAVLVTPLKDAEIVTLLVVLTVTVLMVKLALVEPAATVTLAGVEATPGLLLDAVTSAPPLGAALLNVTVPCELFPPTRLVGFSDSDESVGDAGAACGVKRRVDDQLPATPAEFLARTRHQCCTVESPLTLACDTVVVMLRTSGALKLLSLSICSS
jgi:hypothetical protein